MKKIFYLFVAVIAVSLLSASCGSDEGAVNGVFSVSDTLRVKFSGGNLQYYKTENYYKFADRQWDETGYFENFKNADMNDVFAWGSGKNPELEFAKENSKFSDWGENPIKNGGKSKWRTLSPSEWEYVFLKRPESEKLIGYGRIENVKGVILLPDDWVQPPDVRFKSLSGFVKKTFNKRFELKTPGVDLTKENVYTAESWKEMENAGAVFFPMTRCYKNSLEQGEYWSSGESHLSFSLDVIWPDRGCKVSAFRQAVRLVKDVR